MARDVDAIGAYRTVQALVEQQVGAGREAFPLGEFARRDAVAGGFVVVVNVVARASGAVLAVFAEHRLELLEQVRIRAEVAEMLVAGLVRRGHRDFHITTVVAVKRVAFDVTGLDLFAEKDLFEGVLDGRRAGAAGSGNRQNRVLDRHRGPPSCATGCGFRTTGNASFRSGR